MIKKLPACLNLLMSTFILVALASGLAQAAPNSQYNKILSTDAPQSKDHPLTGRYEGSSILLQTQKAFDELSLPNGKTTDADYSSKKFSKAVTVEGGITRTVYVTPMGRSSLEIFRNFTNSLTAKGYSVAWECANESCGPAFKGLKYNWSDKRTQVQGEGYEVDRSRFVSAVFDGAKDIRYALLRKNAGSGAAVNTASPASYIGIYAALNSGGTMGDLSDSLNDRVTVLVEVQEPKAMQQNIVILDSDVIGRDLKANGLVRFYGIYFDSDKAVIKPESKPQLDEMAKYLKTNTLKVFMVGHTDTQGALDYNMTLSSRRAQAVVDALKVYGVAEARITAKGVGPLAPLTANDSEPGRAKNRRVEMVLQN